MAENRRIWVFLGLFALVLILSFIVIQPFLSAILGGAVLAYIFYPIYKRLIKGVKNETLAALITSIIIILMLIIPAAFLIDAATEESRVSYVRMKQLIEQGSILSIDCEENDNGICKFATLFGLLQTNEAKFYLQDVIAKGATFVIEETTKVLLSLPNIILNLFVTFFTAFYLLIEGEKRLKAVKRLIPLRKEHSKALFEKLRLAMKGVILGSLLVALIQGAMGALGFYLFDIGSPILWGTIMAVFALVPFIGTGIIWAPAGAILILIGATTNEPNTVWRGVGLLAYGALIISSIDNLLKPKLIAEQANVHPVLVLVGALGGLIIFGPIGFVAGPIILALLQAFVSIYEKEVKAGIL